MHREKKSDIWVRSALLAAAGMLFALLAHAARGEVVLPKVFADHMVIQRRMPVHVWGWAAPHEKVSVKFRGEEGSTTANDLGQWDVYLKPGEAGGPFSLEIDDTNKVVFNDILVGDLWIASGQSNMEMPLNGFGPLLPIKNAGKEIAEANHPSIRFLKIAQTSSDYPLDDARLAFSWEACSPETVGSFSAVGYFFARDIQDAERVPIGVIVSAWGGTPIDSWISLRALTSDPSLMPLFALSADMMYDRAAQLRVIARERKEEDELKKAGGESPKRPEGRNVLSWQPGALFNGMIAPLTPLPIKGVIWYQGESDSDSVRAPLYAKSFATMITDWRQAWRQPDMPFLYVQISRFGPAAPSPWSVVREAQRRTLSLAHTAMAVSADLGNRNNIHPPNKQDIGSRLALAARAVVYGESTEFSDRLTAT